MISSENARQAPTAELGKVSRRTVPASPASGANPLDAKAGVINSVQYLRAIAAWLVVVYHLSASMNSQFGWSHGFALGAIGVDVFFVISGYIMAMIAAKSADFAPVSFLLRRFARIAPLYWLMTLAFVALCLVFPAALNDPDVSWSKTLFSLLFMPDFANGTTLPALIVGWTLNYEFFFYAIVAATVWITRDRTLLAAALALTLCVLLGMVMDSGAIAAFYTQPILLEFVFGILIWNYGSRLTRRRWFAPLWFLILPPLFAALFVSGIYSDETRFLVWGVPAAILVLGGIPLFTARLPWLALLGDWSFATYLLHVYVIQLFVKFVAGRVLDNPFWLILGVVVAFAAILVGSAIQFALFERPVTRTLNRWIDRWRTRASKPVENGATQAAS